MKYNFSKRLKDLPSFVWDIVYRIDTLKSKWHEGVELDRQILTRLKKSTLVTSTGASTRIEGSKLSDREVEQLMKGLKTKTFKDRDKQEVIGYYELLNNVFEGYQSIPLSESTIKFFHKQLLKYVEKDEIHRGEYKKTENQVAILDAEGNPAEILFETTPSHLTVKQMQELIEWFQQAIVEKESHSLILIGNFIVEFLRIHPFKDGNGRLSRILSNMLFLQHGYAYVPYVSHEQLIEQYKTDYYIALRKSQKTFGTNHENVVPWLTFFLDIILEQSKKALELLSQEETDKLLSPQQKKVLQFIEGHREAFPLEIAKSTGVPRPTVSQAIEKLLRLKRIERIGSGRATRYKKTKLN